MRQYIIDFIHGFAESLIHNIGKTHELSKDIEKSKAKIFSITIAIAMISAGIFLAIWGISSYIDSRFAMQGLGFVLVGTIAILIGIIIFKR